MAPATIAKISRFAKRQHIAARKAVWRGIHAATGGKPIFILGAQRSGTTMLLACLESSMQFDVFGETSRAMKDFVLLADDDIRGIITSSAHRFVVFKPLTGSHRAHELLDLHPEAKIIWAFRRVSDRASSAVAKFGDHNLQILRQFAKGEGLEMWQAQGLTPELLDFIRSFDYSDMTPETAAAIFWYVRNSLFFTQGLDTCDRAMPLSYEDLVYQGEVMRGVCAFVGAEYHLKMVSGIHGGSVGKGNGRIDPEVAEKCQDMYDRLYLRQAKFTGPCLL